MDKFSMNLEELKKWLRHESSDVNSFYVVSDASLRQRINTWLEKEDSASSPIDDDEEKGESDAPSNSGEYKKGGASAPSHDDEQKEGGS